MVYYFLKKEGLFILSFIYFFNYLPGTSNRNGLRRLFWVFNFFFFNNKSAFSILEQVMVLVLCKYAHSLLLGDIINRILQKSLDLLNQMLHHLNLFWVSSQRVNFSATCSTNDQCLILTLQRSLYCNKWSQLLSPELIDRFKFIIH